MKKIKKIGSMLLVVMCCMCNLNIASHAASVSLSAKVSYSAQTISLSWNKVSGVNKYYIYRAADWETCENELIATVNPTNENTVSYKDTTAFETAKQYDFFETRSYSYTVAKCNKDGRIEVLAEKKVSFVPSAYSVKVSATTHCSQVMLKWNSAKNCTAYRVYEKTGNGNWKAIKNTSKISYTVKNRKPNTTYQYMVRPYTNVGGNAVFRKKNSTSDALTVKATTKKISTPVLKSASRISGNKYQLKWSAVTGASGYRVYKKTSAGWKKVSDTSNCSLKVSKGTYTVKAYVKYSGKTYWGGYDKTGLKIK